MAKSKNDKAIVLPKLQVVYVHLDEPSSVGDNEKKTYSLTFLIPKDHRAVDIIEGAMKAAYAEVKESKFKGLPFTSSKIKKPLRDGDAYLAEKQEEYEAKGEELPQALIDMFEDNYYLKVVTKDKPTVYDQDGEEMYDVSVIKGGDYCRADIAAWAYSNESMGITFFINSVKFIEEGEPLGFSASRASASAYDDDEDDEPRRKPARRSRDEDEDDDRPVRKGIKPRRRDDDEDEDDRPVRRRSARDEEDEDDRPVRRGIKPKRRDYEDEDDAPRGSRSRRPSRDDEDDLY